MPDAVAQSWDLDLAVAAAGIAATAHFATKDFERRPCPAYQPRRLSRRQVCRLNRR
jgi:hypothetical protein